MDLDKALQFAVILAWEDLLKVSEARLARVEYRFEPGVSLEYLSVWSVKAKGYQDKVCDYWISASPAHSNGISFSNGNQSDKLARGLDLILKNQGRFMRPPADACPDGLVLIYPPSADERAEAATWMREFDAIARTSGGTQDEGAMPLSAGAARDRTAAPVEPGGR